MSESTARAKREEAGEAGTPERSESEGVAASQPLVDLEYVKGLIAAVDGSGIDSLEIARSGTRIRIAKSPPQMVAPAGTVAPAVAAPPVMAHLSPPAPAPAAPAAAPAAGGGAAPVSRPTDGWTEIKSPMVGTFYRAPAPEAPPYVEVGTRVVKGQTLCILEAMKLMNELEAEVSGTIRAIEVENAEPVEYGQVLFRIEPDA